MQLGRLRLEVLKVGRVGEAHKETHGDSSVRVQAVRARICSLRPPGVALEEAHGVKIRAVES